MKNREFTYVGGITPDLTEEQYIPFVLNFQTAVIRSLEKRKLLNGLQAERCVEKLTKQSTMKKKQS